MVNSSDDDMTIQINPDDSTKNTGKSFSLDFESTENAMLTGIRVRPADLARLFGVTKQSVSSWVKDGRVVLGFDGRVDPRAAISRLLATGDPARLRASFLKPIVEELTVARQRMASLEAAIATVRDDSDFYKSTSDELSRLFDALIATIEQEWNELHKLPAEQGLTALLTWLDVSLKYGVDAEVTILDFAARSEVEKEGSESTIYEEKW